MLTVTQEMQFARKIADRIVFTDAARIVDQGPPAKTLDVPQDGRTKAFLCRVS